MARLSGPVVAQLQAVFLADHYFETNEAPDYPDHFPDLPFTGRSLAQLIPSGPGYSRENGQEFIVALLIPRVDGLSSPPPICAGRDGASGPYDPRHFAE